MFKMKRARLALQLHIIDRACTGFGKMGKSKAVGNPGCHINAKQYKTLLMQVA